MHIAGLGLQHFFTSGNTLEMASLKGASLMIENNSKEVADFMIAWLDELKKN